MNSELGILLKIIKEKTGIDIDVFSANTKYFISTKENAELVLPSKTDFYDVFSDTAKKRTFFKFKFMNGHLLGSILGAGKSEKIIAQMILTLIENSSQKDINESKAEYVKNILLGELESLQVQKFIRKFLVEDTGCVVYSIVCNSGKINEVFSVCESYVENSRDIAIIFDETTIVIIRFTNEENNLSNVDFASILSQTIYEETSTDVQVGIGAVVRGIIDANVSFSQSQEVLNISKLLSVKGNIHNYKDYFLAKILQETPITKLNEYLDVLVDSKAMEIFKDDDMLDTAEEFLSNSLNISETSRKLYMHRNTLMYRLDKIEKTTGLNIRNFPDAITFKIITILLKTMDKK